MGAAASGAVLAGGTSRRLGTDKRLVLVEGRTLLARTVDVLRVLVDDVQVVVGDAADDTVVARALGDGHGVTVRSDARAGCGPVAGLETALAGAAHDLVLVVATDHPALSPDVLRLLLQRARTTAARAVALTGEQGPEPLLAVYRRDALATVRAALDAGTRRMRDVLAALAPELVTVEEWRALDPTGRTVDDVDVPGDLAELGHLAELGRLAERDDLS
jgi:molybdopterin-guanine dinucleotide biosynthesis protein A